MSYLGPDFAASCVPGNKPERDLKKCTEKGKLFQHVPIEKITGRGDSYANCGSGNRLEGITFDGNNQVVFRPKSAVPFGMAAGGTGNPCFGGGGGAKAGSGAVNRDPSTYQNFASSRHHSAYYKKPDAPSTYGGIAAGRHH